MRTSFLIVALKNAKWTKRIFNDTKLHETGCCSYPPPFPSMISVAYVIAIHPALDLFYCHSSRACWSPINRLHNIDPFPTTWILMFLMHWPIEVCDIQRYSLMGTFRNAGSRCSRFQEGYNSRRVVAWSPRASVLKLGPTRKRYGLQKYRFPITDRFSTLSTADVGYVEYRNDVAWNWPLRG